MEYSLTGDINKMFITDLDYISDNMVKLNKRREEYMEKQKEKNK
jgi:hypothetical protein